MAAAGYPPPPSFDIVTIGSLVFFSLIIPLGWVTESRNQTS